MLELRILGPLDVTDGERFADLRRPKPRAVLAVLLLHPNQVVPADRLVDAVWGDRPPPSATNTLQGYVSYLRQAIADLGKGQEGDPAIRTQAPGYTLVVDPDRIDAQRFERLLSDGRRAMATGDHGRAAASLREALSLWRGPALADLAAEPFASLEAARLEELRLAALEEQADAELALGRHGELIGRLQAMVEENPLRERLWAQLMLALYRCGRQAEALRAYQAARRILGEELGIEPSPALRRLEADVLAQAPSLEASAGPATGSLPGREVPFPPLLAAGSSRDYVGREDLLVRLRDARRAAGTGSCRAAFLAGEPGIGKTRTAAEVARAAFADGAVVLYGRCQEEPGLPYQPFVEALDWYTGHAPEPVLGRYPAELIRLQPLLASRVPSLGPPVSSDPRSEEHLLFEATGSWLVELARRQPVVLVLDDLHWASKPVLLLLRHVLRAAAARPDGVPLLLVGTYRVTEVDRGHPLLAVMAQIRRLPGVEQVSILGLSPAEVEEFVCRALGDALDDDTRTLAGMLHAETEGNPFFLDEVLRHLVETGVVARSAERWTVADRRQVTVPQGVRDVIGRRLDRLSTPAARVLSVAAVIGRDFDAELVAALTDLSDDDVLDALDEAVTARLVQETGADHYRFAHALVRAALYEDLSATRRKRAHLKVAEMLEKLRPDDVVALAHHLVQAEPTGNELPRAVRYALAAAEQALGARALADAEARFRRVLGLLAEPRYSGAPERAHALCGLGEAQRDQGDARSRATLLAAARTAEEAGDLDLLVRAALSNSRWLPSIIGGIDRERLALTEAVLEAVGPAPSADRARLLAQLAAEVCFTRDDRRRLALAAEAERMARALGDDALLAEVLNRTGYAAFAAGRTRHLVARAEEAAGLADASGDPAQRVLARYFWSGALLTAGDIPAFRRVTEEMAVVAAGAAPTLQWLAMACTPRLAVLDGRFDDARRLNDDAFALAQELDEPDGAAWWTATLTVLAWCHGAFDGIVESLDAGTDVYPDEPAWAIGYAMVLAMEGREAEARDALQAQRPDPEDLVDHVFPFLNTMMCAVIAFQLDDVELAARTATALRPYQHLWVHHYAGTVGPVGLGVALCAATTGDLDESVSLFEEADRTTVALGCRGLLAQLRTFYAAVLARRGRQGDRERAADLLAWLRRDGTALAAPALLARGEQIAARLDGS
ncbi:MAG TPA: BTAD domain-containing putative transcriptional regulator [Acidimicrobiales bacterium]|nr:BTAD domain-containing putative transcriptional regulator [Acidimicrobiales bacterium]